MNTSLDQTKVEISASMMCVNWLEVGKSLTELDELKIDALHWDILDGNFAPDYTMGTSIINTLRAETEIKSDYHLMVEEPSRIFDTLEVGTQDTITIHQECSRNLHRDLVRIRRKGCRVGLALCPGTPLESLEYVLEELDQILLLMVNPGFAGQSIIPQTFRKIEKCRDMIQSLNLDVKIQIDGNVSPANIAKMVALGGRSLVGGSSGLFRKGMSLFESTDIMRKEIDRGLSGDLELSAG